MHVICINLSVQPFQSNFKKLKYCNSSFGVQFQNEEPEEEASADDDATKQPEGTQSETPDAPEQEGDEEQTTKQEGEEVPQEEGDQKQETESSEGEKPDTTQTDGDASTTNSTADEEAKPKVTKLNVMSRCIV